MSRLRGLIILASLAIAGFSCSTSQKAMQKSYAELDALQKLMTGTFTSGEQAKQDSAFYDITLQMYPIWKNNGHWLYVEQAVTAMPHKPYRQRVYKLEKQKDGSIHSIVYTLPDPDAFIGAWENTQKFDQLSPDELSIREGCAVILEKQKDGSYAGSTDGQSCTSTLRGASYATSKVSIQPGVIISWDQGFNEAGEQVWGAVKAGYEFRGLPVK